MESKGQVLEEVVIPLPRPRSRKCGEWPTPSRRPCGTSQAKDKGGCWRRHATQTNQDATPRPRPRIASFIAPLPRRPKNPKYHDQAGYLRRQLAKAKKAANFAQGEAKKAANLANKEANKARALVLLLATQEKKAEEQEKKAKQAQVGAQAQVAAAMAVITRIAAACAICRCAPHCHEGGSSKAHCERAQRAGEESRGGAAARSRSATGCNCRICGQACSGGVQAWSCRCACTRSLLRICDKLVRRAAECHLS